MQQIHRHQGQNHYQPPPSNVPSNSTRGGGLPSAFAPPIFRSRRRLQESGSAMMSRPVSLDFRVEEGKNQQQQFTEAAAFAAMNGGKPIGSENLVYHQQNNNTHNFWDYHQGLPPNQKYTKKAHHFDGSHHYRYNKQQQYDPASALYFEQCRQIRRTASSGRRGHSNFPNPSGILGDIVDLDACVRESRHTRLDAHQRSFSSSSGQLRRRMRRKRYGGVRGARGSSSSRAHGYRHQKQRQRLVANTPSSPLLYSDDDDDEFAVGGNPNSSFEEDGRDRGEGFLSDDPSAVDSGSQEFLRLCRRPGGSKRIRRQLPLTNGRLQHFPSLSTIYPDDNTSLLEQDLKQRETEEKPMAEKTNTLAKENASQQQQPTLIKQQQQQNNKDSSSPVCQNPNQKQMENVMSKQVFGAGSSEGSTGSSSGRSNGDTVENHCPPGAFQHQLTDPLDDLPPVIQPLRLNWRKMHFGGDSLMMNNAVPAGARHPKTNPRLAQNALGMRSSGRDRTDSSRIPPKAFGGRGKEEYPLDPLTSHTKPLFDQKMYAHGCKTLPSPKASFSLVGVRPEQFNLPSVLARSYGIRGILFIAVYVIDWMLVVQVRSGAFFFPPLPQRSSVKVELKPVKRKYPREPLIGFAQWSRTAFGDQPDYLEEFRFQLDNDMLRNSDKLGISVYASSSGTAGYGRETFRELIGRMSFSLRKFFRTAYPEAFSNCLKYRDLVFEGGVPVKVCDGGYFLLPEGTGAFSHLSQDNIMHRKYYDEIGTTGSSFVTTTNTTGTTATRAQPDGGALSTTTSGSGTSSCSGAAAVLGTAPTTTTSSGDSGVRLGSPGPTLGSFIVPLSPIRAQQLKQQQERAESGNALRIWSNNAPPTPLQTFQQQQQQIHHPNSYNTGEFRLLPTGGGFPGGANEALASVAPSSIIPAAPNAPGGNLHHQQPYLIGGAVPRRTSPFFNEPVLLGHHHYHRNFSPVPSPLLDRHHHHRMPRLQRNSDGLSNQSSLTSGSGSGGSSYGGTGILGADMSEALSSSIANRLLTDYYTSTESSTSGSSGGPRSGGKGLLNGGGGNGFGRERRLQSAATSQTTATTETTTTNTSLLSSSFLSHSSHLNNFPGAGGFSTTSDGGLDSCYSGVDSCSAASSNFAIARGCDNNGDGIGNNTEKMSSSLPEGLNQQNIIVGVGGGFNRRPSFAAALGLGIVTGDAIQELHTTTIGGTGGKKDNNNKSAKPSKKPVKKLSKKQTAAKVEKEKQQKQSSSQKNSDTPSTNGTTTTITALAPRPTPFGAGVSSSLGMGESLGPLDGGGKKSTTTADCTATSSSNASKRKIFGRSVKRTLMGPLLWHRAHMRSASTSSLLSRSLAPPKEEVIRRWQQSFNDLLHDKYGRDLFRCFLAGEHSDENLDFWVACEEFKQLLRPGPSGQDAPGEQVRAMALDIYRRFIATGADKEVNLESAIKNSTFAALQRHLGPFLAAQHDNSGIEEKNEENQLLNLSTGPEHPAACDANGSVPHQRDMTPAAEIFTQAQSKIEQLMASDSYQRFLKSELYLNLLNNSKSDKNNVSDNRPPLLESRSEKALATTEIHR